MAGAKPGVHVVQLKTIQVPDSLLKGNKFIKWDDDTAVGTPVTLRVESKGFILYWRDQHKETDCLDISIIRDTRTGKYAKIPKDAKLRESIIMGSQDVPLEEKMLTICFGTDMVNLSYLNFAAASKETAKEWADLLFHYATNLLALNHSPLSFMEKCYTRLSHVTNSEGKIPVKNILKMFAHKDDKRRAEKALESARLPSGKNDMISPSKFTQEDFFSYYRHLVGRTEVDRIFHDLGAKKKPYLTVEQFQAFLNTEQRDPRLNEILYPFCDKKKAQVLIDQFEPNNGLAGKDSEVPKGHLSQEGFLRYLMSDENALISPEKLDLSEDMDQPLSHYFINSSHNTYLTGHQLTGKSSVEIYRQTLLTGCRCVELDCWDGKGADEEPIITHGFTMCTEIVFKEVIEAIAETAFKVSDYPVILSFENHCSPKQQAKMAQHCRNILGEMLLTDPLDSHPLESDVSLPSPAHLRRKVLIKNKKRHLHKSKTRVQKTSQDAKPAHKPAGVEGQAETAEGEATVEEGTEKVEAEDEGVVISPGVEHDDAGSSSESEIDSDEEGGGGGEGLDEEEIKKAEVKKEKGTASQEAEAGMEMSALVNYIQPARFHTFENADKRNRSYECTSFVETQATALLKEFPVDFVNFNKRQLSRIYPKGTRVDSSNYMPQIFWNAGCQLVALNFQTLDLAMQLNLGIFEYNGRSGYILKPDFMRRKDRRFDPFAESTVDGIVAGTVEVKVIAGQFLTEKKVGTYVEVDMYGLPADTVRKKFRTKVIPGNGISPVYDEEPFVFRKVVLPNLATLRIAVCDENGKLLGHRVLPVEGLRPGYRHICLRNELNQPLNLSTLFVHITVKDYVPDSFADFAAALANPIAYQSQLEKHAQQLAVLEEDFETPDEAEVQMPSKEITPATGGELSRQRNASLLSRKKEPMEGTPINLSRVGSLQTKHMQKQESTVSGTSAPQGSGSSGTVPPMSRMISSVTVNAENGGVTTTQSVAATSRLNGPKSTSLPSSPLHSVHTPHISVATAPPVENNGAVKAQSSKIDVVQTTRLKDPEVIEAASMDSLRDTKQYQKLAQKVEKELDALRKKHEKARVNMQELHELQEEKLILSHVKSKTTVEKIHRKSVKRASKHGRMDESTSVKNQQELSALVSDQEKKVRELKQNQTESSITLYKEHFRAEMDLQNRHYPMLYDTLDTLVSSSQLGQQKKLDEIHDKEVNELKKKLDAANREEMKTLAKKHKDKNELARIKREAMQKHIQMAVHEREKLRDILMKRKGEVEERHKQLRQEVGDEKEKHLASLKDEFEERCAKVEEEQREGLQTSPQEQEAAAPDPDPEPEPSVPKAPTPSPSPTSSNGLHDHINNETQDTAMVATEDTSNGGTEEAPQ